MLGRILRIPVERKGCFVGKGSLYSKIPKDRKEHCRCIFPKQRVQSLGLSVAHGEAGYHQEREKEGRRNNSLVPIHGLYL
jgi:hypothetical protein